MLVRLNLVLLLILVGCAFSVVTSTHKARKLFAELEKEQQMSRQLDVEWGQLQLEQSTWGLHSRIEQIAASQLHMQIPQPGRMQIIDPSHASGVPAIQGNSR